MAKKILIIDDEPELITILKVRLESQQYSVACAEDGMEGLKKIAEEKPDLIILDVMMPRMDGFTFILEIKKIYPHENIPIIVLTAKQMMSDLFKVEGIREYMVKPFDVEDLFARIKKYI